MPQLSPAWRHSRCIVNVSYFRPAILQASGPNAARRWFDAARCGDHRDRVDPPAVRQRATVRDARLVEMDMRPDEPGTDEPPGGVIAFAIRRKRAADRGDPAWLDGDVERPVIEPIDEPRIPHDQIHLLLSSQGKALASLDDLIGAGEQVWRNFERERFRCL